MGVAMSIRTKTIEDYAEQVVQMAGHHRLVDVMQVFEEREYAENEAYLVVCEANGRIGVISFLELADLWDEEGVELLEKPLAEWDIPEASRKWKSEEIESGLDIVEWVKDKPNSRAIVVNEQGEFVYLFTNPNLSGTRALESSLPRLHGMLVMLRHNSLRLPQQQVYKVTCPHCQHRDEYTITGEILHCKNPMCKKEIG